MNSMKKDFMEVRQLGPVRLELFEGIKSLMSFSDFCAPAGTIDFKAQRGFLKNRLKLFTLTYKNFFFEAKIEYGRVFVKRNELYQHSEQYFGDDPCEVAIQWNIDSIGCGVVPPNSDKDMHHHLRAVKTPVTIFPSEIVRILRKENLLYNQKYKDMDTLFVTIIDSIRWSEHDIRRHGAERLFWIKTDKDIWKPRDEPDISRSVASFLSVYGALKNFDVTCESIAGTGEMDFYIVAPVAETLGKIVVEAKKAESGNLVCGFTTQLPDYMRRVGTNHGVYLIYWLKSDKYPYPVQYKSYNELEIDKLHPLKRPGTVRTMGMNFSL